MLSTSLCSLLSLSCVWSFFGGDFFGFIKYESCIIVDVVHIVLSDRIYSLDQKESHSKKNYSSNFILSVRDSVSRVENKDKPIYTSREAKPIQ